MKSLIIILVSLTSLCAIAQNNDQVNFQKEIGFDMSNQNGKYAIETSDSNFIIVGSTDNNVWGEEDFFVLKTDRNGDTLWTKAWGSVNTPDYLTCILETNNKGLVVCGKTHSYEKNNSSFDAYIAKITKNGDVEWFKTYGGLKDETANYIIQTAEGEFVFTMTLKDKNGFQSIITKTSANGEKIWTKQLNSFNNSKVSKIVQDNDGNLILSGSTRQFDGGDKDVFLITLDKNGNILSSKTYGKQINENCIDFATTNDGEYLFTGNYTTSDPYDLGNKIFIMKSNQEGIIWYKQFDGAKGLSILQASDSNIIVGGVIKTNGHQNAVIVKLTNNDGEITWVEHFGYEDTDWGNCLIETSDGSYALFGETRSKKTDGFYNILFVKTNSDGYIK